MFVIKGKAGYLVLDEDTVLKDDASKADATRFYTKDAAEYMLNLIDEVVEEVPNDSIVEYVAYVLCESGGRLWLGFDGSGALFGFERRDADRYSNVDDLRHDIGVALSNSGLSDGAPVKIVKVTTHYEEIE